MPRFIYFYTMTDDASLIGETVPEHVSYWRDRGLDAYEGGPFADRSGGLITFAAQDLDAATMLAGGDPFVVAGVVRDRVVKEWLA